MATLKYKKKYGEIVINCDCGREHTITQEKEDGKEVIFIMETDDSNIKVINPIKKESEKENENQNNNGGTIHSKDNNSGKKKSFFDFEL
jgi:hypothetical protein